MKSVDWKKAVVLIGVLVGLGHQPALAGAFLPVDAFEVVLDGTGRHDNLKIPHS